MLTKFLAGIVLLCCFLTTYVNAKEPFTKAQMKQSRELKYIPGVGYADPFAVALLASVPVLILLGFGSLFFPLILLMPRILAIPANNNNNANNGGTRARRANFFQTMMQERIKDIYKMVETALELFGEMDD